MQVARKQRADGQVWPSTAWKSQLRRRLLAWYSAHARDLPWRRSQDPYRIWVSEIMLQQTQVATVEAYFHRFVSALPTVAALAQADESQVLRLWEGLGYYRRARQMHKAAQTIVREHDAQFPRHADAVRELPGIGRYTAGAILSIAFDAPEPILEANTIRLFSRLLAYRGDPYGSTGQKQLWVAAEQLLPKRGAGTLNQALMDLGSQICTPRAPRCLICPVANLCPTNRGGLQGVIPPPKVKPVVEQVREAAVIIRRSSKILLMRRTTGKRWLGLWDFPRFELQGRTPTEIDRELRDKVTELTGLEIELQSIFTTLRHGVTRFRITLDCYSAQAVGGQIPKSRSADLKWVLPSQMDDYPLSTTGRKIARRLAVEQEAVPAPRKKLQMTRED